jgi:hypothetical protein
MARLPYVTPEQLPESERDLFDGLLERFGRVNNIFRVIAHSPPILRRLLPLGAALRHATQPRSRAPRVSHSHRGAAGAMHL